MSKTRNMTLGGRPRKLSRQLQRDIRRSLKGSGFSLFGFAPNSVGVQGDGRVVGPVVVLQVPPQSTAEQAGTISTKLINEVRGITRVLIDIPT